MDSDIGQLDLLPQVHREALAWFANRTGHEISWPSPVDGLYLMNRAKGIHKPLGWVHALSVRQSLNGPYADKAIVTGPNGTWTYDYLQEGVDDTARDNAFTNRALIRNMKDGVPVAVVQQVKGKPASRYHVLGLAYIESWEAGYFRLRSLSSEEVGSSVQQSAPTSLIDARRRINREIIARQGAGGFRAAALEAFNRRCAITGYDVVEGLEAAHIVPYLGTHTNDVSNSLLLRADIHTLFDRGLITVDPATMSVAVASSLKDSSIGNIHGTVLQVPVDIEKWRSSFENRNMQSI